jgi:hypothetical protein
VPERLGKAICRFHGVEPLVLDGVVGDGLPGLGRRAGYPWWRWTWPGPRPRPIWVSTPYDDTSRASCREVLGLAPCVYCCAPVECVDHIEATAARGGDKHWTNVAAACRPCNVSKGAKSLLAFMLYRACGVAP